MRIVDKTKFFRMIFLLGGLLILLIIFCSNTYSTTEIKYKEEFITSGDTLWKISQNELENNKYFENKDIREVVNKIKTINNLQDTKYLSEGQKIIIPQYK